MLLLATLHNLLGTNARATFQNRVTQMAVCSRPETIVLLLLATLHNLLGTNAATSLAESQALMTKIGTVIGPVESAIKRSPTQAAVVVPCVPCMSGVETTTLLQDLLETTTLLRGDNYIASSWIHLGESIPVVVELILLFLA
jgi:hypothetical protein